jgi:peptide methionine sulfoxide reductase msrA/msrB
MMKISFFTVLLCALFFHEKILVQIDREAGEDKKENRKENGKKAVENMRRSFNKLTKEEREVIENKGTEAPFSGRFDKHEAKGFYICRRCDAGLYLSRDKFASSCGWPSFDDAIPGAVERRKDADGRRTEILCAACGAHLGHVFEGEGFTEKNTRHCVNSLSLDFVPMSRVGRAVFAGGCFWGMEYHFQKVSGVLKVTSGFMGGDLKNPSYKAVCSGTSGHVEVVELLYDTRRVTYDRLARLFFEIHDPSQKDRQGPDIGKQYRSAVFFQNEKQKKIIEALIEKLEARPMKVFTSLEKMGDFYPAEACHQNYYRSRGQEPYCHVYTKRFED